MSDSLLARPPGRIAVAGDWHGNIHWVRRVVTLLRDRAPEVPKRQHLANVFVLESISGQQYDACALLQAAP